MPISHRPLNIYRLWTPSSRTSIAILWTSAVVLSCTNQNRNIGERPRCANAAASIGADFTPVSWLIATYSADGEECKEALEACWYTTTDDAGCDWYHLYGEPIDLYMRSVAWRVDCLPDDTQIAAILENLHDSQLGIQLIGTRADVISVLLAVQMCVWNLVSVGWELHEMRLRWIRWSCEM